MESQNKNLKSIFLNFLLLLAFIFSVMALYISLSFSEKTSTQKVETTEDEFILEVQELYEAIAVLEKKVTDQANSLKTIQNNLTQMEKTSVKNQLKVVNKELISIFNKNNIKQIECLNKKLDPNLHQSMMEIEDDEKEPGTIIQEVQKGFTIKDRLLRPSLVGVSKKSQNERGEQLKTTKNKDNN